MRTVKVRKDDLLEIVRTNRNAHRAEFEKALEGYKLLLLEELEKRIEEVRKGKKINRTIGLTEPMDMTKEYDAVIRQLELSIDSVVELDDIEFSNYVMDDWTWKDQLAATNTMYAANARKKGR